MATLFNGRKTSAPCFHQLRMATAVWPCPRLLHRCKEYDQNQEELVRRCQLQVILPAQSAPPPNQKKRVGLVTLTRNSSGVELLCLDQVAEAAKSHKMRKTWCSVVFGRLPKETSSTGVCEEVRRVGMIVSQLSG